MADIYAVQQLYGANTSTRAGDTVYGFNGMAGPLFDCAQRYSQALMTLMMHSTACIAVHPVQERCCRWLLMTHDRVGRDDFHLSQEFLAIMLGSTRPTVSLVASTLQKAGLITYTHGHMRIVDRPGLEAASCECYGVVRAHFERLGV